MADLIPLDAEPLGEGIIERLEWALAKAKAGELSSIGLAVVYRDGCTGQRWSAAPSFALLIGSTQLLVHKLCHKLEESA